MNQPTPICAFDIAPDGTATPCALDAPQGAGWRWIHLDLTDNVLEDWLPDRVPHAVATSLLLPETRPRFDEITDGALINLRGVNLNDGADPEDMVALRVWATPSLVMTLRRRQIMAVDDIRKAAEAGKMQATPVAFLSAVAEGLTLRIETVSLKLEDQVDDLEEAIFSNDPVDAQAILELRQTLIKVKRFIGPQRDALVDFAAATGGLVDAVTAPHLMETANRAARTVEALEAARDRLGVLQDHLDGQAAAALGRNGYVLSIIAAIFLPLGFLTGLFGVNVAGMPGVEAPWAFAALCGASAILGLILYLLFRALKWL